MLVLPRRREWKSGLDGNGRYSPGNSLLAWEGGGRRGEGGGSRELFKWAGVVVLGGEREGSERREGERFADSTAGLGWNDYAPGI